MDVGAAVTEIASVSTAAAAVGGAILAVVAVIAGYRLIRRAF